MNSSRVYVGGLPSGVRERDLERFFKGYGRTRDILLKNGYGFVEFEDSKDAEDAVYELDGKDLLGRRLVVELAKSTARGGGGYRDRDRYDNRRRGGGRYNDRNSRPSRFGPPQRTEYRLIVENLSSSVSWQDLKDYVRQAGEVTYCDAHRERRNEGVVEFISRSDMRAALEKLDDTDLNGRRIRLVEDRNSRRGGGGGRSRSRSGSRRRSRSKSRRSTRSRSKSRSRSKARGRRSKSKSAARSKSRSRSRSKKSRELSKSKSRSRSAKRDSRSRSNARRDSRSPSKSRRDSRDRSKSRPSQRVSRSPLKSKSTHGSRRDSRSRSRERSYTRSRSASPRNANNSNNRDESMDD